MDASGDSNVCLRDPRLARDDAAIRLQASDVFGQVVIAELQVVRAGAGKRMVSLGPAATVNRASRIRPPHSIACSREVRNSSRVTAISAMHAARTTPRGLLQHCSSPTV